MSFSRLLEDNYYSKFFLSWSSNQNMLENDTKIIDQTNFSEEKERLCSFDKETSKTWLLNISHKSHVEKMQWL